MAIRDRIEDGSLSCSFTLSKNLQWILKIEIPALGMLLSCVSETGKYCAVKGQIVILEEEEYTL